MRQRSTIAIVALLCLTLVAIGLVYARSRQTLESAPETTSGISYEPGQDERPRLAVVGDSISQGDSDDFSKGDTGPRTWVHHLDTRKFRFVGGVVKGGMTSQQINDDVRDDIRADVVVYMLGTNDIQRHVASAQFVKNITKHHDQSPRQSGAVVVVTAVGPIPGMEADTLRTWNSDVKRRAKKQGFVFIDPWTELRTSDFAYRSKSLTFDGLHPNSSGAKRQGASMTGLLTEVMKDNGPS